MQTDKYADTFTCRPTNTDKYGPKVISTAKQTDRQAGKTETSRFTVKQAAESAGMQAMRTGQACMQADEMP